MKKTTTISSLLHRLLSISLKTLLLASVITASIATHSSAQDAAKPKDDYDNSNLDQAFGNATNVISLSAGIGGRYSFESAYSGTSGTPLYALAFEHGVAKDINIGGTSVPLPFPGALSYGGFIGYKKVSYKDTYYTYNGVNYGYDYSWSDFIIGVRGAYHLTFVKNLDTYVGLMAAYDIVIFTDNTDYYYGYGYYGAASYSTFQVTPYIGARYYLGKHFGVFGEIGYGASYLNLGLQIKAH